MDRAFRVFVSDPSICVYLFVSEHPISKMAPRERAIHLLRNAALVIPKRKKKRAELEQDLSSMGCNRFLDRPWALKSEEMVHKFVSIKKRLEE